MHAWRTSAVLFVCMGLAAASALASDSSISISSPAFAAGHAIPSAHAYKGFNLAPEIDISGVPAHAKSLVLIVDDPDSPSGLWSHWTIWNLPADTTTISADKLPPGAMQGKNSFGHERYDGPVPPSGTHRYFFRLYALDSMLKLDKGADRAALDTAMEGHVIGEGEMFGTYTASP